MNTITVNELRKELKKINFKIKTESFSFGKTASIFPSEKPEYANCNVFTKDILEKYNYSAMNELMAKYKGFKLIDNNGNKVICKELQK